MRICVAVALALTAAPGCAALQGGRRSLSPGELRADLATRVPEVPSEQIVVPHEISPLYLDQARTLLSEQVGPKSSIEDQVQALLRILNSPSGFMLRYEWAATRSADQTIEEGGGSCLSLSAVLIALARGMGIRAHYVDASRASSETRKDGDLTVHSGHIAVILEYKNADAFVDFAGEITDSAGSRAMSDTEVVAHYYNNRGYELIHEAQRQNNAVPWKEALDNFRIAAKISPRFALAWNNVGLALARLDRTTEAILAFRYALALEPRLEAARRNLSAWPGEVQLAESEAKPDDPDKMNLKWKAAAGDPAAVHWKAYPLRSTR